MVEVFKTNMNDPLEAKRILKILKENFPGFKINFDLQDCDRILRVEAKNISAGKIIQLMNENKYWCKVLENHVEQLGKMLGVDAS